MKRKWTEVKDYVPLWLVLVLLPLITYLHIYQIDLADYAWHVGGDTYTDFFSYFKQIALWVAAIIMLWIVGSDRLIGKSKYKIERIWILLVALGVVQLVSGMLAASRNEALFGGYQHFEGTFSLISYSLVCYYAYRNYMNHKNTNYLVGGVIALSAIWIVPGIMQALSRDLFQNEWVQKIIMPSEYVGQVTSRLKETKGYLTLANPNTASMYLSILLPILLAAVIRCGKRLRVAAAVAFVVDGAFMILTNSRVGLVAIVVCLIFGGILCYKDLWKYKKVVAPVLAGVIGLLILVDGINGFSLANRLRLTVSTMTKQEDSPMVEDLYTDREGIHITVDEVDYLVNYETNQDGEDQIHIRDGKKRETSPQWDNLGFMMAESEDEMFLNMVYKENVLRFTNDENQGYMLYTGEGNYDKIPKVDKVDFHGFEKIASGRGYIWSRSLPLLKRYWLFGCGADNYYRVFPQNDYVGKANYCDSYLTTIEKPHNMFLQMAIQNGIPALLICLAFYGIYFVSSIRLYWRNQGKERWMGLGIFLGTVCYMIGAIFNDSSVLVSPLFWILVGTGMAINKTTKGAA